MNKKFYLWLWLLGTSHFPLVGFSNCSGGQTQVGSSSKGMNTHSRPTSHAGAQIGTEKLEDVGSSSSSSPTTTCEIGF